MKLLWQSIKAVLGFLALMTYTGICAVMVGLIGLVRLLLPFAAVRNLCVSAANGVMRFWCSLNALLFYVVGNRHWDIQLDPALHQKGWYLLIANHQSWADIVLLTTLTRHQMPMMRFFTKKELAYVPIVGLAAWAMDMPFMQRYSREYLLKHPEKRGQDLVSARKACEKFRHLPTTIVNFCEGTRRTAEKQRTKGGQFNYVLPPKAPGCALTLSVMEGQIQAVADASLYFPYQGKYPFMALLGGGLSGLKLKVEHLPIEQVPVGDYMKNKEEKRAFQQWLGQRWLLKDQWLTEQQR